MTTENTQLDEKFEASFNVNASVPDPINTKDNSRPADKKEGEKESKSLTKAQMISGMTHASYRLSHPELTDLYRKFFAMSGKNVDAASNRATIKAGGLKEDMDAVFEGSDLSEEFKDKATTIFEAAVNSAIVAETARLEEEFEARLEEAVAGQIEGLEEAMSKYMDHVAEQWIEENRLQIETGLRADIAESFMTALKGVFLEHYIDVPEEAVDVVEALTAKVDELTTKLDESQNAVIEANNKLNEATAASILATVSEGLTESQKEKLVSLAEDIDFVDAASYQAKLSTIVEGYVNKPAVVPADQQLNEELELHEDKKAAGVTDPMVAAALAAISKNKGK